MKYKIRIGEHEYEVEKKGREIQLNGKPVAVDLVQTSEKGFHLVADRKSYAPAISSL